VPTGNTEFQFPAANLNFHATSYDWLVITSNQAQYQGSGTINGAGNYGFQVTALDNGGGSTPDDIRLKIWDKNNNAIVYDTQPGAANTAAPITVLGGGRIQVHSGGGGAVAPGGPGNARDRNEPLTPLLLGSLFASAPEIGLTSALSPLPRLQAPTLSPLGPSLELVEGTASPRNRQPVAATGPAADNSRQHNTLLASSGLDWFWETFAGQTINRPVTDLPK
jgi:hypothetical protein